MSAAVSVVAVLGAGASLAATPALAAQTSPWWHPDTTLAPATLSPGGQGTISAQATNIGDAPTSGPVSFSVSLPSGVSVVEEGGVPQVALFLTSLGPIFNLGPSGFDLGLCEVEPQRVECHFHEIAGIFEPEGIAPATLAPYEGLEMRIKVQDKGATAPSAYHAEVSGGGAAPASLRRELKISGSPPSFGAEYLSVVPEEEGGRVNTQAGSHPYQLTATVNLDQGAETTRPPALAKDLHFRLPPGQLGNALAVPQCSSVQFSSSVGSTNACPSDTSLGVAIITSTINLESTVQTVPVPLFNLEPAHGEPARFGFVIQHVPIILDTAVRSRKGEDYGVTVTSANTSQVVNLISATTVFWGAPADPSHDASRGWGCLIRGFYIESGQQCEPSTVSKPPAFVTLPTNCAAPYATTVEGVSWADKENPTGAQFDPFTYSLQDEGENPLSLTGCNQVPFAPAIAAELTSNAATSPTGLNFDIDVNDEGLLNSEGLAQSQIKRTVVTLPEGFTTNPSVAEGLKACSEAQYESETVNSEAGSGCPNASKIGDVEIQSPLVEPVIHGSLYVAKQGENPNPTPQNPRGNLLTLYLVAKNPEIGVIIKQALRVTPDPVTGRLTTEVDNIPQLPFSHFRLSFRQGQRSPLITPPICGNYDGAETAPGVHDPEPVRALLYPYSNPTVPLQRESSFQITQGPEGGPCPNGVPPFHPNLEAGTTNNAAGTYSPFVTKITRKDSEQEITHFSIKLPPGVIGKLAGVSSCTDAQIAAAKAREKEGGGQEELNAPSCPANSEVGHSLVGSGVGNVLAYAPGKLYLAGPYHGSPISIVSITAAKVGPFDLGTVVVRFALNIDHETAEVSVDGANSDPIPHIVDGIPIHLRDIRAYVDRPNFTLNPTSCAKKSTAATILGSGLNFTSPADDVPVTISSPFQAADCASLGFKPNLKLSLKGGTKRSAVPRFKAVLTYPKKGAYANIAKAQVTLPSSVYLEQNHIRTVCTKVIFAEGAIPGEKCPAASIYGHASAVTPLLDDPIQGPVYLRSPLPGHLLPDLVAALSNGQISVDVVGRIDSVHRKGSEISLIRNTFEAVPDAPVSKFTLEMQGGKKGLLVNSTNICKGTHRAKADFTGQNGKIHDFNPVLEAASCGKGGKKKHHGRR